MKRKIAILAFAGLSLLTTACFDDMFGPVEPIGPSVTTGEITNAQQTSFRITGTISGPDYKNKRQEKKSGQVVEYGFVYGTSDNPTAGTFLKKGDTIRIFPQTFDAVISGLRANTAYKVWAYAKTEAGVTQYGNEAGQQTTDFPLPIPNFSLTTPGGNRAPAQIHFNTSDNTPGAQYRWEFGSEGTSTQKNPAFVFNTGGSKNIKLTITANGKTAERVQTISILPPFTRVRISRIKLLKAPAKNPNGSDWDGWDLFNPNEPHPDVYVAGLLNNQVVFSTSVHKDATQAAINNGSIIWTSFTPAKTFSGSELNQTLQLALRDQDGSGFVNMGTRAVLFGNHKTVTSDPKYPTRITLNEAGFLVGYEIDLVWEQ